MNARLYDASLHRFLSPDTYIQDPYNTQNYNRYGYCVNNPLKYTDITGNVFNIANLAGCIPVVGSIFSSLLLHQNINWEKIAINLAITAVVTAVTFGVGAGFTSVCNFTTTAVGFWSGAAIGAATGFVTGVAGSAAYSLMSGGSLKLGQLLTAGAIGAVVGGVLQGIDAGNRAVDKGNNFWSGKSPYSVGNSKWFKDVVPFNKNDLFDFKYDVNAQLPCKPIINIQKSDMSCTFEQKIMTDGYYGNLASQTNINTNWLNDVSGSVGLKDSAIIMNRFSLSGYSVNPYYGAMTNESALPWMVEQISNNRIINIELQYSLTAGHNVSAWGVHYNFDYKKIYIDILNSAEKGRNYLQGLGQIKAMFSVWKP